MTSEVKERILTDLEKLAVKFVRDPEQVVPSVMTKLLFYVLRHMHQKGMNPVDQAYWREKGWLEKKRPWKKIVKQ